MTAATVTVENLGKCYRIYPDAQARIKELLCFGAKKFHIEKWAIKDINFKLHGGQALGIIGFNGAIYCRRCRWWLYETPILDTREPYRDREDGL